MQVKLYHKFSCNKKTRITKRLRGLFIFVKTGNYLNTLEKKMALLCSK